MKYPHSTRLCSLCLSRPAKFKLSGIVRSDSDHNICLQCFRSISDQQKASQHPTPTNQTA